MATTPSSSCWRAAASSAGPSSNCGETTTPALLPTSSSRRLRRSPSGWSSRRLGVEFEQVEQNEHGGAAALLQQREAGAAVLVERADLPVEHCVGRANSERDGASDVVEPARQILAVTARERHLAAGDRHDRAKAVPLRLVDPALADRQRIGRRGEHRLVRPARGCTAVLPQEQPVLRIAVERGRHERPHPVETLAVQTYGQSSVTFLLEKLVGSAIPDLDRAGAVLAGGDLAFEVAVLERVILDVHREVSLAAPERDSLRNRPAGECSVAFEPKVVVETPRVVSLDHESRLRARSSRLAERLRCLPGTALPAIFVEAHLWIVARFATLSLPTGCTLTLFPAQAVIRAGDKPVEGGENLRLRPARPSRGTSHAGDGGARRARATRFPRMRREWPVRGALQRRSRSACAPPGGSATIASTTPSSRQCAASGLNAAAALRASPASRHRIAAHPSGEMTE